jgi:hypothetical protein
MQMPGRFMHNTFWLEDQITFTFSTTRFDSNDKPLSNREIINSLNLQEFNQYLNANGFNLRPFTTQQTPPPFLREDSDGNDLNDELGKYLFPPPAPPIGKPPNLINVVTFFHLEIEPMQNNMVSRNADGSNESQDQKDATPTLGPIPRLVNLVNGDLKRLLNGIELQGRKLGPIPITSAAPNWLCGSTSVNPDRVTQGCPLTPPFPVQDDADCQSSPGLWHISLPDLPRDLDPMTGDGVKVFVLDTLPNEGQIKRAAKAAEKHNLLLLDVANNVTFTYPPMSDTLDFPNPLQPTTGKDVYGRDVGFRMPDHGLFIAGIIRDIAPNANVECIRVLNDLCSGSTQSLTDALDGIQKRMQPSGDLFNKSVVINLSLVATPSDEDVARLGFDANSIKVIRQHLLISIQSLVDLGVIFVASAGNEGDMRYTPMAPGPGPSPRPKALYPAYFAYDGLVHPERMIPVGAVDKDGNATTYSCYPGDTGIATYGGEVPMMADIYTDSNGMTRVKNADAIIGIYSSMFYPALSFDDPQASYPAPNSHGWAYWVGTSFSTPIISAVVARALELKLRTPNSPLVIKPPRIVSGAVTKQTVWTRLPPDITSSTFDDVNAGLKSAIGSVIQAEQQCASTDRDGDDEKRERVEVRVTINERD